MTWPLLQTLSEEERRRLLGLARRRRFRREEVVFHEGDPGDTLHLIDKGHVAVRMTTPLGHVATVAVRGPGEVFGQMALISSEPRSATVAALDVVETLSLHRHLFTDLRQSHPGIDRFLLKTAAAEISRLSSQLLEVMYVPVEKRIPRRLLELASLYGGEGTHTLIPLTQEEIAEIAGATRPTVNKVLRSLEEAGMISLQRGSVQVLDRTRLASKGR